MQLIDYLKDDHDAIRVMMHEIDVAPDIESKKRIFGSLGPLLRTHFRAEELVLYSNGLKINDAEVNRITLDLYEEHRFIEDFVNKIKSSSDNKVWETRMRIFFQILDINFDTKESGYFIELKKRFTAHQLGQAAGLYLQAKGFEAGQGSCSSENMQYTLN